MAVVGVVGVMAFLKNNALRTGTTINVISDQVDVSVKVDINWAGVEVPEQQKHFETTTNENGIIHGEWQMADLVLTTANLQTPAKIQLAITNNNEPTDKLFLKVQVKGLAFDAFGRFQTGIKCEYKLQEEALYRQGEQKTVTSELFVFTQRMPATVEDFKIDIDYSLIFANSSFNQNQGIEITISTEDNLSGN